MSNLLHYLYTLWPLLLIAVIGFFILLASIVVPIHQRIEYKKFIKAKEKR